MFGISLQRIYYFHFLFVCFCVYLLVGLVPGGLRRPETQSVCVRQDRGLNRPENWLNRFLVAEQLGAAWGLLRLPEADLYLIPGFDANSVFPPILPFFHRTPTLLEKMKISKIAF